jgi:hypothetical protein
MLAHGPVHDDIFLGTALDLWLIASCALWLERAPTGAVARHFERPIGRAVVDHDDLFVDRHPAGHAPRALAAASVNSSGPRTFRPAQA